MATRLELHELLCSLLGSRNVYFQGPEKMKMNYPAIVYNLDVIENSFADDQVYSSKKRYLITLIESNPDSELIDVLSKLPTCKFNRYYAADNLNHYSFTIFF